MLHLVIEFYPLLIVSSLVNLSFVLTRRKNFFSLDCSCLSKRMLVIFTYIASLTISFSTALIMAYISYESAYVYYYDISVSHIDLFNHKLSLVTSIGTAFSSILYMSILSFVRNKTAEILDRLFNIKQIRDNKQ